MSEKKIYECGVCGKALANQKSLIRHHNQFHTNDKLQEIFSCQECPRKFKYKANLIAHLKNFHGPGSLPKIPETKCALCQKTDMRNLILDHYQKDHDVEFEYQDVKFDSKDEFFEWKKEVERVDNCLFVKNRGMYVTKGGMVKLTFKCFRDGKTKELSSRQRRMKLIGSNKIGCCPARIEYSSRGNDIRVKYCRTHVHYKDPSRMPLTEEEKDIIAEKIASGCSLDDILKEAHTHPDSGRLFYLTRKNLLNLARLRGLKIRKKIPRREKKTEKEESEGWSSDEAEEYFENSCYDHGNEQIVHQVEQNDISVNETPEMVNVTVSLEERKIILSEQWTELINSVDSHQKLDVLSDYCELFQKLLQ